jgi:hypothetical protein
VTLQQDVNAEDAEQFAKAIGLLRGVVSVEPRHPDFFNDQAAVARTRQKVYDALAEAFDPKKTPKSG